jgi:ERCC4-type nuclease
MCEIIVDNRESKLIEEFTKRDIKIRVEVLDIGDVLIVSEAAAGAAEASEASDQVRLVFERKTGADLSASLKDGRYKEQKQRLLANYIPSHITYIIENKSTCTLSKSTYDGVICNTLYRDGIHIMFTDGIQDTTDFLCVVASKVAADPLKYLKVEGKSDDYIHCVKIKSKRSDNIDQKTCYLMQLGQIPGVSSRIAGEIATLYPSMSSLIQALQSTSDPTALLSKIPMIGDKKAKIIFKYLI